MTYLLLVNDAGASFVIEAIPQLSLTIGEPRTATVPGHIVISAGAVMVGYFESITVMVKLLLFVPQLFVNVKFTVVSPLLKVEPLPVPLPLPDVAPENEYETLGVGVPIMLCV